MVFRVRATWRLVIMSPRRRGVARGGARIEELRRRIIELEHIRDGDVEADS